MKNRSVLFYTVLFLLLGSVFFPILAHALDPDEIVVVANRQARDGVELARFYMEQRKIPKENLLVLQTAFKEDIPRHFYEDEIADP
ncbi:TIGR03790 family protein, partial [Desulfocapsa sp. AH-315-G09]|nr:TIGR03790 family protein [Desulfocapsa sp. AH-315-G09]